MLFQGVEMAWPVAAVATDPLVDLGEPVGAQRVDPALRLGAHLDQPDFSQYPQMSGHRWLGQAWQRRDELAGGPLAVSQHVQQRSPAGLGHRFEHVHDLNIAASLYTLQQIYSGWPLRRHTFPSTIPALERGRWRMLRRCTCFKRTSSTPSL